MFPILPPVSPPCESGVRGEALIYCGTAVRAKRTAARAKDFILIFSAAFKGF
jgi:hypothetical protein